MILLTEPPILAVRRAVAFDPRYDSLFAGQTRKGEGRRGPRKLAEVSMLKHELIRCRQNRLVRQVYFYMDCNMEYICEELTSTFKPYMKNYILIAIKHLMEKWPSSSADATASGGISRTVGHTYFKIYQETELIRFENMVDSQMHFGGLTRV
jgi:hypothetical protein